MARIGFSNQILNQISGLGHTRQPPMHFSGYLICRFRLAHRLENRGDVSLDQSGPEAQGKSGLAPRAISAVIWVVRGLRLGRRVEDFDTHRPHLRTAAAEWAPHLTHAFGQGRTSPSTSKLSQFREFLIDLRRPTGRSTGEKRLKSLQ